MCGRKRRSGRCRFLGAEGPLKGGRLTIIGRVSAPMIRRRVDVWGRAANSWRSRRLGGCCCWPLGGGQIAKRGAAATARTPRSNDSGGGRGAVCSFIVASSSWQPTDDRLTLMLRHSPTRRGRWPHAPAPASSSFPPFSAHPSTYLPPTERPSQRPTPHVSQTPTKAT